MENDVRAQADAFIALPRSERSVKYNSLPQDVKNRARRVIEARRGIAYRTQGGDMVFTKEEYMSQITRLAEKAKILDERKAAIASKIVEFKKQLEENYGEEALGEAETALEA